MHPDGHTDGWKDIRIDAPSFSDSKTNLKRLMTKANVGMDHTLKKEKGNDFK